VRPVAGAGHASEIAKDSMWVWNWWVGFVVWVACWVWTAGSILSVESNQNVVSRKKKVESNTK